MTLLASITSVCLSGMLGGFVNAPVSGNGFLLPKTEVVYNSRIIRPGFLGNILIGAVASMVSWGIYGPLSATPILALTVQAPTLSTIAGALLVGVAVQSG